MHLRWLQPWLMLSQSPSTPAPHQEMNAAKPLKPCGTWPALSGALPRAAYPQSLIHLHEKRAEPAPFSAPEPTYVMKAGTGEIVGVPALRAYDAFFSTHLASKPSVAIV
ncbi:hypothetical protein HYPSUDRAFT_207959 [Hypholoma sublateritium FD-334 SS-4]|uniref:Uncharacterized protein n=1 Tax=Hypholoma sublateritium (strain FD-334 SS-4) TaxID=945553 RepID=A0A0D2NFB1_HYPSF|nr:hypothetical protein HYPSUDRAFT_207959 [Hypholoma sublateritium FD-334 SS-4]